MVRRSALLVLLSLGCPSAETPETHREGPCDSPFTLALGACVPYALAAKLCGPGSHPSPGGGCVRVPCAEGESLDRGPEGGCLPASVTRLALAETSSDKVAVCSEGTLVAARSRVPTCEFGPLSCAAGETYARRDGGGACEELPTCKVGEIHDGTRCARVVRGGVVDVGTWTRLALGPDGGEGSGYLCARIRQQRAAGAFSILLEFPDNDTTQVSARLTPIGGTTPVGADLAQQTLATLIEALRFLGGTSGAATVSLQVRCSSLDLENPSWSMKRDAGP